MTKKYQKSPSFRFLIGDFVSDHIWKSEKLANTQTVPDFYKYFSDKIYQMRKRKETKAETFQKI